MTQQEIGRRAKELISFQDNETNIVNGLFTEPSMGVVESLFELERLQQLCKHETARTGEVCPNCFKFIKGE